MRRTVVVTTAWITATILAVSLAFAGVNLVADRVLGTESAPVVGSATFGPASDAPTEGTSPEEEPSPDDASPDDTPSNEPTAPEPTDEPTTATVAPSPTATTTARPSPTASSSPDDDPTPSESPSASPSDDPSDDPSDEPTSSPSPPSSSESSAPAETRTYRLTGGTVTVRFSSSEVRVVSATPNEGFSLHEIEQPAPTVIDLEFRAHDDSHRSKLDAWWQGGPRERVREEARD